MPSFVAYLTVGSFHTDLNYIYLDINQAVDSLGRPASMTRGGKITVEFNSTNDFLVAEWMVEPTMRMDGNIRFMNLDSRSTLKEIVFSNAYCIDFHERFDGTDNSSQMVTIITISPEKINVGGIELDNKWPETE
ncbi:type VI secretion system tube protein TssD [Dyadobacter jiangsuensis]|uniref:Uncharacterized protein n=1 Tax=Dyadobacter jiangsuensis TaxID=1591085 RepID=A0A2P8G0E2_9BACT|nr:type VI secretion system tube protein TssD [Dyadobacter jiangsuensis]PSL27439.1 hypothetical protein CLV60_108297 [Dyadobacter jiangsuensis]